MSYATIQALDGLSFDSYLALPDGGMGPGLIVIHEIFGLNASMRDACDFYASKGFVAICPDLFARQNGGSMVTELESNDLDRAAQLYKNFDVEAGVRDLLATLAHVRKMPGCGGKVGTIGSCLGGRMSFLMASRSDVDCVVGYDNIGIDGFLDEVYDIRMPLLLHFGEQDKLMPVSTRQKILQFLKKNPAITPYLYPTADHGFARKGGQRFHPESSALAQERTLAFLNEHLKN